MLYTETDHAQVTRERNKRRWVVLLPTAVILLLAVASFVWFRLAHNVGGWIWTALITIVGGAYFLFFYEVYLRPVSQYRKHVEIMLNGRKRETLGILKERNDEVSDHDGMDCSSLTVNVGQRNDPEDDRLFYLDAQKTMPPIEVGTRVCVLSNDRMVADVQAQ